MIATKKSMRKKGEGRIFSSTLMPTFSYLVFQESKQKKINLLNKYNIGKLQSS